MSEPQYIAPLVAVMLIRESLSVGDRALLADAARQYAALRKRHGELIDRIEHEHDGTESLRLAEERATAAAEYVAQTLEGRMPDNREAHVIADHERADFLVATAMQHTYDLLDGVQRLRVKKRLRVVARLAQPPLNDEVVYILRLLDSWDAWELEQQLD